MIRKTLLILVMILISGCAFGEDQGLDLVLMVDTSSSMESYFDDLTNFIISKILTDYLHKGDTFHLLRFADTPSFEIAEKYEADTSLAIVLQKLLLLKQKLLFGRYTDILSGIEYLIHYAETLPQERKKLLILLTDGVNDPPPESPFYGMSQSQVLDRLKELSQKTIDKYGWTVRIIIYPSSEDNRENENKTGVQGETQLNLQKETPIPSGTKSQETASRTAEAKKNEFLNIVKKSLNADVVPYDEKNKNELPGKVTGFPKLIFPEDLGSQGRRITVPFKIENFLKTKLKLKLLSLSSQGTNMLRESSVSVQIDPVATAPFNVDILLPADFPIGPANLPVTLAFDGDTHISPLSGTLTFNYKGDVFGELYKNSTNYMFLIIIIFVIALVALVIFVIIRMHVFENIFADILGPSGSRQKNSRGMQMSGELIEMRVAFQNPHVGFRNIHRVEEDKKASIGGGLSAFLIFLIPIPSNIAEISNENGEYTFTPLKTDFFPDLKEPLPQCLDKDIQIISKHGYRSAIRFHKYVSPLTELNHLLHSANHEV
jgi:hypothetical protein